MWQSITLTEPAQLFYIRGARMSFALHFCNREDNILMTRMGSADTKRENKVIALHSEYCYWLLEDSAPFILLLQSSYDGKFVRQRR